MTAEEDGKDDQGNGARSPKLASISTKGLLSSLRIPDEEDVENTPSTGGRGRSMFTSTPTRVSGTPMSTEPNPSKTTFSSKFLTPSRTFVRLRDEKEELSRLTPSPPSRGLRDGFTLPLIGEVKPRALWEFAKNWLRNPKNLALLVWGLGVAVSGAILFMVMVGMLNAVLPTRAERNTWFEVSNQIINALFTLMCVYLHPQRCLHLHYLYRWNAQDIVKLRGVYCKHGTRKPHEWGHMLVIVLLLQLNCFAQYALCGLNWGYRRAQRPAIGVALCLCLSFGAAATAGIYNIVSPLGKDFELKEDESAEGELEKASLSHDSRVHEFAPRARLYKMLERRVSFVCKDEGTLVEKPVWTGGVFDISKDPAVSILSTLCCVCVFGWNMDRLGFGNRYIHIITFVLICTAPFWIFDLASVNIQNRYVRHAVGGTGIALCAFGLFYGGFWRIRMRERFKLPGNRFCCGKPSVTDCFQWLFCPLCSLCQEVRTAEHYDVKDDQFYSRSMRGANGSPPPGMASPHTPAPTLSAVHEMPEALQDMDLAGVEMMAHDSPFRETYNNRPMASPSPVVASRNGNFDPGETMPRTSTSNNPFLEQPGQFSRGSSPLRPAHDLNSSHTPFQPPESPPADDEGHTLS